MTNCSSIRMQSAFRFGGILIKITWKFYFDLKTPAVAQCDPWGARPTAWQPLPLQTQNQEIFLLLPSIKPKSHLFHKALCRKHDASLALNHSSVKRWAASVASIWGFTEQVPDRPWPRGTAVKPEWNTARRHFCVLPLQLDSLWETKPDTSVCHTITHRQ